MTEIKFFSPVKIIGTLPYETPWNDDGRSFFELNEKQKILCKDKINAEIRKIFSPVNFPVDKVRAVSLGMENRDNKLVSVLTCYSMEELNPQEIEVFQNWWEWQCRYGFGKRLLASRIFTLKYGRLKVMLWYLEKDWHIRQI